MRIILTFLLNAGLNFAVGLVIAASLGPERYGLFAVGMTAATLIATGAFDWLRLSTTRYCGASPQDPEPAVRRTLGAAYVGFIVLIACGALLVIALPLRVDAVLAIAVAIVAVANGLFDYRAALARALFHDGCYAVLVLGKGVLGLALAFGAGLLGRDPTLVLAAQGLGTLMAIVPVRGRLGAVAEPGTRVDPKLLGRFARYGLPIVSANVTFQALTLSVRSAAAATLGYAAAGYLALATDLELRLLLASGAAIDVLVFQLAVRRERQGGHGAALTQLRTNMVIVAALLGLIAAEFVLTLPALTRLVVPTRFQSGFEPLAMALLPGVFLFCLGQFALNPVFQLKHRTMPITLAALISAATVALGIAIFHGDLGLLGLVILHAGGLAVGFVVLAAIVFRDPALRPRWRDSLGVAAAATLTVACLWPLRTVAPPLLALTLVGATGPALYGATLLAFDVGACREATRPWLGGVRRRFAARRLA